MPNAAANVNLYLQLAEESQRLGRMDDRERFWLLAADAALTAGQTDEAEKLRRNILANNPNYFLKPYASLAEAMRSQEIQSYVQELRRHYPPEQAERWLQSLRGAGQPPAGARANNQSPSPLEKAAMSTSQPHQDPRYAGTLSPGNLPPKPIAPPPKPAAPPPAAAPKPPLVFQMEPSLPQGPKAPPKRAELQLPKPHSPGADTPPMEPELQPGHLIGTALFVLVLVAGLAAAAQALVMPLAGK